MLMHATVHNPDRFMGDLRQILAQGRKRIGLLIGAGAPTALLVDDANQVVDEGNPLIPDVEGLTDIVISRLSQDDQHAIESIKEEIRKTGEIINIKTILTQIRRLAQAIGTESVRGLTGHEYIQLADRICQGIGKVVSAILPESPNPYSELVSWISGTQREHSIEIFTANYDLLIEEALERSRIPYFDGFVGAHVPFF